MSASIATPFALPRGAISSSRQMSVALPLLSGYRRKVSPLKALYACYYNGSWQWMQSPVSQNKTSPVKLVCTQKKTRTSCGSVVHADVMIRTKTDGQRPIRDVLRGLRCRLGTARGAALVGAAVLEDQTNDRGHKDQQRQRHGIAAKCVRDGSSPIRNLH